ncbi:sulfotransferase [Allochromatium palmeri]|uniref:Glycosyltransferase n=1 Tax=Allochromatium palmeri TaxID=231048 RepID=A0A6N8EEW2_9GAMM|nr:sulfotransferase [Allochromatium palmeri]MTW22763.1 glycosyltransferase [Allochromatium palmeri]
MHQHSSEARWRIAMLAPPFFPISSASVGIPERAIAQLASGLAGLGHEVVLLAAKGSEAGVETRPFLSAPTGRKDGWAELDHYLQACTWIADNGFNLVHAHSAAALAVASLLRIPLVCTLYERPAVGGSLQGLCDAAARLSWVRLLGAWEQQADRAEDQRAEGNASPVRLATDEVIRVYSSLLGEAELVAKGDAAPQTRRETALPASGQLATRANSAPVLIFGLARSGTTLLCDLLSAPGESLVLHEPMLLRRWTDGREQRLRLTLEQAGITADFDPAHFDPRRLALPWFEQQVLPALRQLPLWGMKEVYLEEAPQLVERFAPRALLLCVRRLEDVVLSFVDLLVRSQMAFPGGRLMRDEAWIIERLRFDLQQLLSLRSRPHRLVRYEDLVSDPATAQALCRALGLARCAEAAMNFSAETQPNRVEELEKHGPALTSRSVGRVASEPAGLARALALGLAWQVRDAMATFGYSKEARQLPVPVLGHEPDPGRRLNDWQWLGEGFDLAYAKRRARAKVAEQLPAGANALEMGAVTPCLRFALAGKASVRCLDALRKGPALRQFAWQREVPPDAGTATHLLFLGSLEYEPDAFALLSRYADAAPQARLWVAYHCREDRPVVDLSAIDWGQGLSRADWRDWAQGRGRVLEADWAWDGYQSLIRVGPVR